VQAAQDLTQQLGQVTVQTLLRLAAVAVAVAVLAVQVVHQLVVQVAQQQEQQQQQTLHLVAAAQTTAMGRQAVTVFFTLGLRYKHGTFCFGHRTKSSTSNCYRKRKLW
jgi:type II secretory pathway pseudopilin PulG